MFGKIKFLIRNIAKMAVQMVVLPITYELARLRHPGKKELVVFADAHHTNLPFSLEMMYKHVVAQGISPVCHFYDYTHEGALKSLFHAISFMDILAQAKYVFICDTFVPVSSGRKCKDTKIVQLCHFSGPFKKIGYDTPDDIPPYYIGNAFKNYDLVSVSSEMYVPIITSAMKQKDGVVQALGVSRSDIYYDDEWVASCKEEFYSKYPNAQNKKILLWAPTFRGKAASPNQLDNKSMAELQEKLGDEWLVLIKHHPHVDAVIKDARYRSNCSIPTEKILPMVDFLITDYSTTVLDYLTFNKPFIFYVPDLEEYQKTRGLYIDYHSLTKNIAFEAINLDAMVKRVYQEWKDGDVDDIVRCKELMTSACDGKATARIIEYLYSLGTKID